MMKKRFAVRIVLTALLLGLNIVLLVYGWDCLFFRETVSCGFNPEQAETDIDYVKYRVSFSSGCIKINAIDVRYEGMLTPETMAVQCVLYDGSRMPVRIRRVVVKSDSHIVIEINEQRRIMADGTSQYDLCFEKGDNVYLKKVSADVYTKSYPGILVLSVLWIASILSMCAVRKYHETDYCEPIIGLVLIFIAAVIEFSCVELLGNEMIAEMAIKDIFCNIVLLILSGILMSFMLNSFRNGIILKITVYGLLGIVNHYLVLFRSQPLQPSDFFTVKTALSVAGDYKYSVDRHIVYAVSFMSVFLVVFFGYGKLRIFRNTRGAFVGRAVALLTGVLFFTMTYIAEWMPLIPEPSYWNVLETYCIYGFLPSFITYGRTLLLPDIGYSDLKAEKIMSEVGKPPLGNTDGEKTNIIIIMNEAMADHRNLGVLRMNDSPWKYWESLAEESLTGRLKVPVYAGGTANTEYEVLTGHSMGLFKGNGVPYTMYKDRLNWSIADVLRGQGYETVAMHPNIAANYNRDVLYPAMGFEKYLSIDNYFEDARRLRGRVSDYGDYAAMLEWISNRTEERPYFLFNITMQNHSDYVSQTIPIDTYAEDYDYADVNEYLTLLKRTDQALEYMIESLRTREEKTVVVIFGDHYPEVNRSFVDAVLETGESRDNQAAEGWKIYEVPLMIWANYDLQSESEGELYMSANYLGSYLIELLGLTPSPYESFLHELREQYPVVSAGCYMTADGRYHEFNDIRSLPEKLYEYYVLQYEQIFRNKHREFYCGYATDP